MYIQKGRFLHFLLSSPAVEVAHNSKNCAFPVGSTLQSLRLCLLCRKPLKNVKCLATYPSVYAASSQCFTSWQTSLCCGPPVVEIEGSIKGVDIAPSGSPKKDSCTYFAGLNSETHKPCVHAALLHWWVKRR